MSRPDSFIELSFKNSISNLLDKKGVENVVVDHLSRIPNALSNKLPINDDFLDEQLSATFREP